MFHRHQPWIAALLAVSYSLIAVVGYGLHALAPCGDAACDDAAHVCSCGFEHDAPEESTPSHGPAFDAGGKPGHNPHTCGLCTVLAKVKVGFEVLELTLLTEPVVSESQAFAAARPESPKFYAHSPRGPPMATPLLAISVA